MTHIADTLELLKVAFFTPMGDTFIDHKKQANEQQWGVAALLKSAPGMSKSSIMREFMSHMYYGDGEPAPFMHVEPGAYGEAGFGVCPVPETYVDSVTSEPKTVLDFPPHKHFVTTFAHAPGLLLLDELSCAQGAVLDALLTCIQAGTIGTAQLNPRVRRFGAMNPSEQTANGGTLPVAVCNRMLWLDFHGPSTEEFLSYLADGGGMRLDESKFINIDAEERRILNAWPAHWAAAVGLTAGFLQKQPQYHHNMPDLNSDKAAGPWPSPRTWEYVARVLCTARIYGLSDEQVNRLVFGLVGNEAGAAWYAWTRAQDLPDIDALLAGQATFTHNPDRLDRTAAVLTGMRARLSQKDCPNRRAAAAQAWRVVESVAATATDLVEPFVASMYRHRLHAMAEAKPVLSKMRNVMVASEGVQ